MTDITEIGSQIVGAALRRVRLEQGLSLQAVAQRTGGAITANGLGQLERARYRVSVDHLLVLAAALEVSPAALLMPPASSPSETVELPGGVTGTAAEAWSWITATGPLPTGETPGLAVAGAEEPAPSPEEAAQLLRSWPRWDGLPPRLRRE
ncbi:helix-turn-helix domain-containing protein [Corynebacterium casei]|uniref:helix-turn-helix domain-containing protein n=1 Tax=Corynebacterium casei TaxID=160386 RepID=UPI003FB853F2